MSDKNDYWFKRSNYMAKFLNERSLEIIKKLNLKYKK
jgi:hypothetical protein|tara:strand:- start:400 stop:510 length:111 start_codon:yes stop_codon:yes gene_type:complete